MAVFFVLIHLIRTGWQFFQSLIRKGNSIDRKLAGSDKSRGPFVGNQQEEAFCPICRETLRERVSTDCGHLFCQACLVQHAKTSASQLYCPTCRKPCSEGVLGTGYVCQSHQKRLLYFCEESSLLLCEECEKSTDHKSHNEPTIDKAMRHYKRRLKGMIKKFKKVIRKSEDSTLEEKNEKFQALQVHSSSHRLETELESQNQTGRQLDDHLQQQQDQMEDILDRAKIVITDLEKMVKELDASKLKDVKELLNRYEPFPFSSHIYTYLKTHKNTDM
ncbi:E3 ubiquitin ligase TRIM40 [Sorex araneus]|uniref:E3 ubiquitin ligase TRIM40 n=1 Tax=Sorex araneus TaxID=42254 RepID=UPI002433D022|nr:E3 ubiquitin ligase TRIM40 [Sorex araneus]